MIIVLLAAWSAKFMWLWRSVCAFVCVDGWMDGCKRIEEKLKSCSKQVKYKSRAEIQMCEYETL